MLGNFFFTGKVVKHWSREGTGYPGKWLNHHPHRYLKDMLMWLLGTWFRGGFGSVGLMVGLDALKMFSNLNDAMIL